MVRKKMNDDKQSTNVCTTFHRRSMNLINKQIAVRSHHESSLKQNIRSVNTKQNNRSMFAIQVKYINKHRCRSQSYRSEGKETSQAPLPSTATGSAKIAAIQKAVQRQSRKKPADDAYVDCGLRFVN